MKIPNNSYDICQLADYIFCHNRTAWDLCVMQGRRNSPYEEIKAAFLKAVDEKIEYLTELRNGVARDIETETDKRRKDDLKYYLDHINDTINYLTNREEEEPC